ncbi:glutamine dumper 3 [Musa troglodytarum]|uniref:Glutamine dumper 3 n=1 Tax=Musa troglodytarum TaxID=320322 RepID=A0A9E7JTD3_9LILI|nr:glutamine dumper 3 [Musa troglodytarum]
MAAAPASAHGVPHSAWHSPVPYLFGGLAAMMGLVTLALLILACSYWKLSSFLESGDGTEQSDHDKHGDASSGKDPTFPEERFFVIMAGDCTPTFLAIPIASRAVDNLTDTDKNIDGEKKQQEGTVTSPVSVRIQMEGDGGRHRSQNEEQ